jgi:hypothetical protein
MSIQSRATLADGGEWIFNAIKRNPEGLLLLAAGAALMLRTGSRSAGTEQSMATAYGNERSQPHASPVAEGTSAVRKTFDAASEAVSEAARQTADAATAYASAASGYADSARRTVGEQSERITRQTQSVFRTVLREQPLAVVVAGIAAGAAVAAAFPSTELEKNTLGPLGDEVSRAAGQFGDQLKQATTKAAEKLKTAADQRGLNTGTLKDVTDEALDTFKTSLQGQPGTPETSTTGASSPARSRQVNNG